MRDFDHDDDSTDDYFRFTGRARLSREMHVLEGYVRGIVADSRIRDIELKNIIRWISEHQEFADRHPFSEVIPRIQKIVTDGIADEEDRADLLWLSNKFSTDDGFYDDVTSDVQRLQGMLAGILADGRVTEGEIQALESWVAERVHLKQCWPYDELEGIIALVMRDGRIDAQEHEALLQFFGEFVATGERKSVGALEPGVTVSGVCSMNPQIEFEEHCFCFTGKSKRATKDEFAALIMRLKGDFHENLRNDTDFLVVGANGNPCWAYSCYGRKVEDAVQRRRDGQIITIAHEYDFWQAVEALPSDKQCQESGQLLTRKAPKRAVDRKSNTSQRATKSKTSENNATNKLAGRTLVVTGTLSKYKREEIEALIVQHGGHSASSVSKNTDYVVAGEKAGSKLEKAQSLGVPVISEADFDRLIRSG